MRFMFAAIALVYLANGLTMLGLPEFWYRSIPGVADTGPMNPHFIRDIGLAFLACGGVLLGRILPVSRLSGGAMAVLIFIGGHALLHVVEDFYHRPAWHALAADLLLVVAPAVLVCGWLLSSRPAKEKAQ